MGKQPIFSALLLALLVNASCSAAAAADIIQLPREHKTSETSGKICELCEQYTAEALIYLGSNRTEAEIVEMLHHGCAKFSLLRQQCITLVDTYIPLFFLEIETVDPEKFCHKVHLCKEARRGSSSPRTVDPCSACHYAVVEALIQLKDPNTQLEVIDLLLQLCSKLGSNMHQECKKLVLAYAPVTLFDVEKYLETTDVCNSFLSCEEAAAAAAIGA